MSDYGKQSLINWLTGKAAMPALVTPVFMALFTTIPNDSNVGGVEPTGNGYARASIPASSWNAASGSDPSTASNSANVTFPTATGGGWGTIVGVGFYDASVGGNLLDVDWLGNFAWQPCYVSSASPGVISAARHGMSNGNNFVYTTKFGGSTPSFSQSNFTGLLTVAGATTDTFTALNGATAVNTSGSGNGMIRQVTTQTVPGGVTVSFPGGAPGQIVFAEA